MSGAVFIGEGSAAPAAMAVLFARVVQKAENLPNSPAHRLIRLGRSVKRGQNVRACPRIHVADLPVPLPIRFFEQLEENQKIASCCRHPENHTIEAFYSTPNWKDKLTPDGHHDPYGGVPDIYIMQCDCGRLHYRFMVGIGDYRPFWGGN